MKANVARAKAGDVVTWTAVGRNNGPDPVELDMRADPPLSFTLTSVLCDGEPGVEFDGSFCEVNTADQAAVGRLVTMIYTTVVKSFSAISDDYPWTMWRYHHAFNNACVDSFSEIPVDDPNPANNCMVGTLRISGR